MNKKIQKKGKVRNTDDGGACCNVGGGGGCVMF